MMLAGAEAIAARAQPSGKGGNIVALKNFKSSLFSCILKASVICAYKCRVRTQILLLLTMFIKENILK